MFHNNGMVCDTMLFLIRCGSFIKREDEDELEFYDEIHTAMVCELMIMTIMNSGIQLSLL